MNYIELKKRLLSGDAGGVFKGMATLLVGTGTARLIGLASMPLLTRIYTPEDYGVLAVYAALVTTLAPFLTLSYIQAVPLPRSDKLAANVLTLSATVLGATTLLLSLALYVWGYPLLQLLAMEVLNPWIWLIILGCIGSGVSNAMSMWAVRKKAYQVIAKVQLTQSLIGTGLKVLLGLLGLKPLGLLVGQFASVSGGSGTYAVRFWKDIKKQIGQISWKRMRFVAKYYADYPIFRLPSQVLLALSSHAPLLLTSTFYGASTTGQLGLALTALALPTTLLGETMSKAFYGEISSIGKKQPALIKRLSYAVIRRLFWLSIIPVLTLALAGEWLFTYIFGSQWTEAGQFAALLSIYLAFQFIQKPVSYLLFLFDGQRTLLYLNAQRVIVVIGCFALGQWLNLGAAKTILLYAISLSAHYAFSIVLAIKEIPSAPHQHP